MRLPTRQDSSENRDKVYVAAKYILLVLQSSSLLTNVEHWFR